ncbi:MAG: hypothetical protein KDD61_03330 [Bdellovibrionales bacterium]|nr:hypothetical protein [Bdellovibrionales bacterium]
MKRNIRSLLLSFSLLLTVLTLFAFFQNCSAVDFTTFDELDKAGVNGELRRVQINPKLTESRPEINVITVLDNSFSMDPILSKTQNAFNNMTSKLKGFNGRVSIYTTTQNGGDKSSVDHSTYVEYTNALGELTQIPFETYETSLPPLTAHSVVDALVLSQPHTLNRKEIAFRGDMSASEFQSFTDEFTQSISAIGVDGSDSEEGLCVLMRAIEANRDRNSYPIYLIATNEDDSSTVASCLKNTKKPFHFVPDDVPASSQCDENDTACNYTYKLDYNPTQKTKLKYKYRTISEKFDYTLVDPKVTKSIKYGWTTNKLTGVYKFKKEKITLSYEPYIIRDNIKAPKGSLDTKKISDKVGICDSNEVRSCTEDEISQIGAQHGIVDGSCTSKCEDYVTSEQNKTISDWSVGTCSKDGRVKGLSGCRSLDYLAISSSTAIQHFDSCEVKCDEGSGSRTFSSVNQPNRCSDLTNPAPPNCSASDESEAINFLSWVTEDDINYCNVTCKEEVVSGTISYHTNNIQTCSGVSGDAKGTHTSSCNPIQKNYLSSQLGIPKSEIATCDYICNQDQISKTKDLSSKTSCSVGSTDCGDEGDENYDLAVSLANGPVTSCNVECSNNTPRASCRKTITSKNACQLGTVANDSLTQSCHVSGETIKSNSCELESALKTTYSVKYVKVQDDAVKNSFLSGNSKEDVAQSIKNLLFDVHGENFFLTSFIYPPEDANCQPISSGLSTGQKYMALHDSLPSNNTAVYPNCLADYSPALEVVFDQIVHTMNRTYSVELADSNEWVWSVYLTFSDGSSRKLQKSEYEMNGKILTIKEGIDLTNMTKIDVDVVVPN